MGKQIKGKPKNLESVTGSLFSSLKRRVPILLIAGGLALSAFGYGCYPQGDDGSGNNKDEPTKKAFYYQDADRDGYGNPNISLMLPHSDTAPEGYSENNLDCRDYDEDIYPGAPELCDNEHNDCNDLTKADGLNEAWYNQSTSCGVGACASTGQYICSSGIKRNTCTPGTPEVEQCSDGIDKDCDGIIQKYLSRTYYLDEDGDGFGSILSPISVQSCTSPPGYAGNDDDCLDALDISDIIDPATVSPAEKQKCAYINNDCSIYYNDSSKYGCINECIPKDADLNVGEIAMIRYGSPFGEMLSALGTLSIFSFDPYWLIECEGFSIYGNHIGGSGYTLQIIDDDKTMWIYAAWGGVRRIGVYPGWDGLINGKYNPPGRQIEDFIKNFPGGVECDEGIYKVDFDLTIPGSGSDSRSIKVGHEGGVIERIILDSDTYNCDIDAPRSLR